ncbi:MAG: LCP family protein [Chloroflexota bacterium]|nr:LCP family protein [Chloroflexota bacterium]
MSFPSRFFMRPVVLIPTLILLIAALIAACVATAPAPLAVPAPSTPTPSVAATLVPTPAPTATPQPTPEPALLGRRVTLLVLGSDSNPARLAQSRYYRTDAIILLSVDAAKKRVSMTSLPRDVVDVPLGNGAVWRQKVNGIAFALGEKAMKRAMAATFGVPIDYYVEINMSDFAALVDAIGGIDVRVPRAIDDRSIQLRISAAPHHMNGAVALKYARSRHTTSDYDRDARQQQILAAIVRTMVNPATKINFLSLIAALRSMKTDLPLTQFPALFELARRSAGATLVTRVLAPPAYATFSGIEFGTGRGWIQEPNLRAIRAYVASVLRP